MPAFQVANKTVTFLGPEDPMNISRQVVKFALRLLKLTIELIWNFVDRFWAGKVLNPTVWKVCARMTGRIPLSSGLIRTQPNWEERVIGFLVTNLKLPFPTEMFVVPFNKSLKCLLLLLILSVLTARVLTLNGKHTIGKFSNEFLKSPS